MYGRPPAAKIPEHSVFSVLSAGVVGGGPQYILPDPYLRSLKFFTVRVFPTATNTPVHSPDLSCSPVFLLRRLQCRHIFRSTDLLRTSIPREFPLFGSSIRRILQRLFAPRIQSFCGSHRLLLKSLARKNRRPSRGQKFCN